jgi:hypothetical protein
MTDPLGALRAAAAREVELLDSIDRPPQEEDGLDRLLETFITTEPASETWMDVLEDLALREPIFGRPPAAAARAARASRSPRPVTVEEALHAPAPQARQYLQTALALSADAADALLELPAAALAQRQPQQVRSLAGLANRPLGPLFADIGSSWRASGGYVYAYRPGGTPDEPAIRATEHAIGALLEWGRALLS